MLQFRRPYSTPPIGSRSLLVLSEPGFLAVVTSKRRARWIRALLQIQMWCLLHTERAAGESSAETCSSSSQQSESLPHILCV